MRNITALLFILLFCQNSIAFEQPNVAMHSSLAKASLLLDIDNINDSFLVAVGERGHIIRSHDGVNWQQVDVPSNTTLTSVFFINELLGWAVGHDATILHSQDGGLSWQIQQSLPELERPLLDVAFKDELHGIAVGAYGIFFRTNNGGKSWQQEFHLSLLLKEDFDYLQELKSEDEQAYLDERGSLLPHFNHVFLDGRTVYLSGELGLLAKSNDLGKTWQRLAQIYQGSFYDIARTQLGNLLAVGLRGNIYRSLTNGTPWKRSIVSTTALLNSIVLAGEKQLFILGNNGTLLESKDDGQTFITHLQQDGKALLSGVAFRNLLVIASEVGIKSLKVVD